MEKQHEREMAEILESYDKQKRDVNSKLAQNAQSAQKSAVAEQVATAQSEERMKMVRALRSQMKQLAIRQLQRLVGRIGIQVPSGIANPSSGEACEHTLQEAMDKVFEWKHNADYARAMIGLPEPVIAGEMMSLEQVCRMV